MASLLSLRFHHYAKLLNRNLDLCSKISVAAGSVAASQLWSHQFNHDFQLLSMFSSRVQVGFHQVLRFSSYLPKNTPGTEFLTLSCPLGVKECVNVASTVYSSLTLGVPGRGSGSTSLTLTWQDKAFSEAHWLNEWNAWFQWNATRFHMLENPSNPITNPITSTFPTEPISGFYYF